MSLIAYYALDCDNNCGTAYRPSLLTLCDPAAMEREAVTEGWKVTTGGRREQRRHHCPDCAAKPSEATA